jgi:ribosomal protein L12E/L44/L45/RPP1/RPP2
MVGDIIGELAATVAAAGIAGNTGAAGTAAAAGGETQSEAEQDCSFDESPQHHDPF